MPAQQLTRLALPDAPAPRPPRGKSTTPPSLAIEPVVAGPRWLHSGTVPSLDGLRAVSISMVIVGHASLAWHGHGLGRLGGIGVDLFFVISGFLITLLLLRERRRNGSISLRAFYVRRCWRILPAYLVFLGALFVLSVFGVVDLTERDWAGALTYTVNFRPGTSWVMGHLWSLSVEEHFYLLWPVLLLLLGPARACALAALYVVTAPVVRLLIWRLGCRALDVDYCTPARMDTIAVGCLLAYGIEHASTWQVLRSPSRRAATGLSLLLIGGLAVSNLVLNRYGIYQLTVRRTVDALCFAGLVWTAVAHADGILARVLNARLLVWIGQLSYGIYLWQQPLLNPQRDYWACRLPVNIALTAVLALASFGVIERPLLRLRERYGWGATTLKPHNC